MRLICPSCQQTLDAQNHMAGHTLTCPVCRRSLTIPLLEAADAPAAAGGGIAVVVNDAAASRATGQGQSSRFRRSAAPAAVPPASSSGSRARAHAVARPPRSAQPSWVQQYVRNNGPMVIAVGMVVVVGLGGAIIAANRTPAPVAQAETSTVVAPPAATPSILASVSVARTVVPVATSAVAASTTTPVPPTAAVKPTTGAAVAASAAPALDAEARDALTWLIEHPDNLPRVVTLVQDVTPRKGGNTLKAGAVLPLGRIIDLERLVVLVDGAGCKLPLGVTDVVTRAKAAKALNDAPVTVSADAPAPVSTDAPAPEAPVVVADPVPPAQ